MLYIVQIAIMDNDFLHLGDDALCPNFVCQYTGCFDIKTGQPLINSLFIGGRRDIHMDLCEMHMNVMIKLWENLIVKLNTLWEFTGFCPLSRWNENIAYELQTRKHSRIVKIVLSQIHKDLTYIAISFERTERPELLDICRLVTKQNIEKCEI